MAPGVVGDEIMGDTVLPVRPVPETRETPASHNPGFDLFSLRHKTVAITGGARGFGITLAIAIAEVGGDVVCLDILEGPAEKEWAQLKKAAKANGTSATYKVCDVTDESSVARTIDSIAADADVNRAPFWGVIACAGVQQQIPALDYPASDFERVLRVNVTGVFNTCKYAARALKDRESPGSIVIIASMSGEISNRGIICTAYNSSKAAVHQMTRSLATEWGQYGIRVNSLSPGYIRTAMTDMLLRENPEVEKLWMGGALLGRLGAPEDFKSPAVFLLSEGAAFVQGTDLRVDGGHCASA